MKDKETVKNAALLVGGAIFLYWGLNNLAAIQWALGLLLGFLFPFLLGGGFAFLMNIPMRAIERGLLFLSGKRRPKALRGLSILLTLLAICAVIFGVVFVVVPQILKTAGSLKEQISIFAVHARLWAEQFSESLPEITGFLETMGIDFANLSRQISTMLGNLGTQALSSSLSFATSIFSGVVNFFIAFVFSLYLLAGKEKLGRQATNVLTAFLPEKRLARVLHVTHLIDHTFSHFFRGQCLEACILGLMFFVGMTIFRFPYAVLISVLVGFTALIPVFGAFIGCVVGAFLILVVDPIQALWFVIFFLVLQQLEGNLIYPRVVGSSVGLPPIWVLVAVTLGGSTLGVVGMLLFIPTTSVIYVLLQEQVRKRIENKGKAS